MDSKLQERTARVIERTARVALCGERAIEIGGQVLRADKSSAYVEFFLSHGFPVTTIDGTGIHPQVVANSYRTMLHKVFDLNHLMKEYDPKSNPRDRILGTIVGVEFPAFAPGAGATAGRPASPESSPVRQSLGEGGWKVQGERSAAPGIRAVAVMHKQAELVPQLLAQHAEGKPWTVSMEQEYFVGNSGFLVARGDPPSLGSYGAASEDDLAQWERVTPEDLRELGWVYVPATLAPMELLDCFDPEKSKITKPYLGRETIILFGGLDGTVRYYGVGMTPAGREKEAAIGQVLASRLRADHPSLGSYGPAGGQAKTGMVEGLAIVELLRRTWPE